MDVEWNMNKYLVKECLIQLIVFGEGGTMTMKPVMSCAWEYTFNLIVFQYRVVFYHMKMDITL